MYICFLDSVSLILFSDMQYSLASCLLYLISWFFVYYWWFIEKLAELKPSSAGNPWNAQQMKKKVKRQPSKPKFSKPVFTSDSSDHELTSNWNRKTCRDSVNHSVSMRLFYLFILLLFYATLHHSIVSLPFLLCSNKVLSFWRVGKSLRTTTH